MFVDRLERRAAPHALIDASSTPDPPRVPVPVHATRPADMPCGVVLLGPLRFEQRLGLAVSALLFPVRSHRAPPVMPHHRGRTEPDPPAAAPEAPAHIDL